MSMDKTEGAEGPDHTKRASWERPVLRRLEASKAEGKGHNVDDGNCVGTGNIGNHSCLS
jgi:hypothetical protein